MKKLLITLLLAYTPAWAVTYYTCDCGTGAESSCAAGNTAASDSYTTTQAQNPATPWRTTSIAGSRISSSVLANDTYLFCKGGAFNNVSGFSFVNGSSTTTKAAPLTISSYTPSWGGSNRPRFNIPSGNGFYASAYAMHTGIVMRGIYLKGSGTPDGSIIHNSPGVSTYDGAQDIIFDDLYIDGFSRGGLFQCTGACNTNVTLKNSTITNSAFSGVYGGASGITVENNIIDNNGVCPSRIPPGSASPACNGAGGGGYSYNMHSIYLGAGSKQIIRNNTITRTVPNDLDTPGRCKGPPITGHGTGTSWIIENNAVIEVNATANCYGIGYGPSANNTGISGIIIRGNLVVNTGGTQLGAGGVDNLIIENNVIINTEANGVSRTAIGVDSSTYTGNNIANNTIVRNNSIYFANGTTGSAIRFSTPAEVGIGHIVANNLIYQGGSGSCWSAASTPANYNFWNYNLCYHPSGTGDGAANTPFVGAQANAITTNPFLVNPPSAINNWSMALASNSPAINAAYLIHAARLAFKGYKVMGTRDIGAYEYGSNP